MKNITSSSINEAADGVAAAVIAGVLGLACVFAMIQTGIELGKKFLGGDSPSWSFLIKYGFMLIALICYIPIIKTVDLAMSIPLTAVKVYTAKVTNNGKKITVFDEAKRKAEREAKYKEMNVLSEGYNRVTDQVEDFNNMFSAQKMIAETLSFLEGLVKFVVILLRQYLLSVLYVLGPIALALSFLEKLEGSFIGFLKYYIVIHLWATVTFAIDAITAVMQFNHLLDQENAKTTVDGIPSWEMLVIQAGLILVNCMTPKIADILVSGSQGGAFFSSAIAISSKGLAYIKSGAMFGVGAMGSKNPASSTAAPIAGKEIGNNISSGASSAPSGGKEV